MRKSFYQKPFMSIYDLLKFVGKTDDGRRNHLVRVHLTENDFKKTDEESYDFLAKVSVTVDDTATHKDVSIINVSTEDEFPLCSWDNDNLKYDNEDLIKLGYVIYPLPVPNTNYTVSRSF